MKIAICTLGCKLNQAESDELKENLQNEGFFIVDWKNKADVYIVNACGLTAGAEQGTRQIIHQARRKNQKAKIFITGCFRQQNMQEVDFYTKNLNILFKKLKTLFSRHRMSGKLKKTDIRCRENHRTRAFVKIQTGCDNFCSFCIIPYFRGKPKSISAKKIIATINKKVAQGFKEIVLTGVNICKYSDKHNEQYQPYGIIQKNDQLNLTQLVKKILNETSVERIRFSSLDPSLIDNEFIALFRNPRIMPHVHLSLQSGSNHILKLMNRKYTAQKYLSLIQKIKNQSPLMGFTTDVIVGFPGETEKDFHATCDLVKKVGFLKVHIFPYSPRPNTVAEAMTNQIDKKTKKDRFRRLKKIADATRKKFIKKMLGKNVPVLFEEKSSDAWFGYTPNYLRIKLKSRKNLKNKILEITIDRKNIAAS